MAAGVPSGSVVPVHARDFGKYQLVVKLATGGMAEIFLARPKSDKAPSRFVVIKRILPHLDEDDQFVAMFLDEARIAARITHPNVCQVYELGEVDGQYFLSLEYLEGITLNSAMRKLAARKQNMDVRLAVAVLAQAAEGLHHAHDLSDLDGPLNIVHRDVSPQNLLVTVEGLSKVLDFGIAKAHGASSRTRTGTVKGKYAYMPPEQLRGDPLDRRTDVWALGVVLFEALTGKRLFWRETDFLIFRAITDEAIPRLRDYRPDAPKELDEAIAKAISRPREERFASAREFAQAITAAVGGVGGTMPASEIGAEVMRLFGDEILAHRELVAEGIKQSESPQLVSNLTPAKGTAIASPPPPPSSSPTSPPTMPANPRAGSQPSSPASGRYARPHSSTAVLDDGRDTVDEGPPRPTRKPKASPLPGATLPLPAPEVSTIAPSSVTGAPPVGAISDPVAALPTPPVPLPPVMPARVPRPSDGYPALQPNSRGYLWVVAACLVAAVGIAVALTRSEPPSTPVAAKEPMPALAPPSFDAGAAVEPSAVPASVPDAAPAIAVVAPPDAAVEVAIVPKEPKEPKEPREKDPPRKPRDKDRDREAAEREREREREKQRDREAAKEPVPAGPPGWISLDSDPYATIFVDGRKVGVTPLARIALPPGPHKVRAISARGEQTFSISIESGKEARGRKLTW